MEATLSHLVILLSLLAVLLSPRSAFADDTLSKGANITDGKTLISSDGTFIMGFFSPGASTKRYLGIWFSGSGSTDAVVWVANRESPVSDKAGALAVSDTGSLVVLDGSMQVAWSSNSTSTAPVEAQLLNSGNLVVRNRGSATILWQSFDYPTNALLSGMKVGVDFWNRFEWHLTSWRSPDDPAPGAFRRVLDTSGLLDNVVWKGDAKTFRTGPWNGLWFSGIPEVLSYKNLIDYQMLISPREVTYGYIVKPGAPFTYVVLTETGDVNRLVWYNSTGWQTLFHGPRDVCDNYGKCGAFGMCNASAASTGFCSCLKGFSQASPSEWKAGCRRDVMLDCGKGPTTDGFMLVPGVKLPDAHNASVDMNTSITVEECKVRCLASCSCVAFAAADIRGNGSGCIIWTDNLIDLRYVDGGQPLYLRLPKSELGLDGSWPGPPGTEKPWLLPTIIAVASVMGFILALALLFATGVLDWWNKWDIICMTWAQHNWATAVAHANQTPPFIDLATVKRATRYFSRKNMIGEGTFAMVYEGKVPRRHPLVQGLPGRTIAVKRLKSIAGLPERIVNYYTREVELVSRFNHHRNVLRFLAYCNKDNERILVYEYMHRSSLDIYIFGNRRKRALLGWQQRLDIVKGIADGVNHLSSANVIHRDLKPANVLLDGGWNAKVADFGTARLLVDEATGTLPRIGTRGYMAPEYVQGEGQTTLKCDVYSFGVTLLETLSGQKNSVGTNSLISKAWRLCGDQNIMALLDSEVESLPPNSKVADQLRRCIKIGLLCVQANPDVRPSMHRVVKMLNNGFGRLDDEPQMPMLDLAALREADLSVPTETQYETVNLRWQEQDDNECEEID